MELIQIRWKYDKSLKVTGPKEALSLPLYSGVRPRGANRSGTALISELFPVSLLVVGRE